MNPTLQKALYIILVSLGLALVFNYLFFSKQIGISVFVITTILLAVVFALAYYQQIQTKKTWWLVLFILFFALMPSLRASEFLTFLNICVTFGLLMLLTDELTGMPVFLMKLLVCTPQEALNCMRQTEVDYLVIDKFLLKKTDLE